MGLCLRYGCYKNDLSYVKGRDRLILNKGRGPVRKGSVESGGVLICRCENRNNRRCCGVSSEETEGKKEKGGNAPLGKKFVSSVRRKEDRLSRGEKNFVLQEKGGLTLTQGGKQKGVSLTGERHGPPQRTRKKKKKKKKTRRKRGAFKKKGKKASIHVKGDHPGGKKGRTVSSNGRLD